MHKEIQIHICHALSKPASTLIEKTEDVALMDSKSPTIHSFTENMDQYHVSSNEMQTSNSQWNAQASHKNK
jgi:hypothetical protein